MADSSKSLWFIAGLALGALVGVLYAPLSGDETRDLIGRKAEEGRDLVTRKASEIRHQAGDAVERGRQTVRRQRDQFQAAVEAGRQAYRETSAIGEPASNE